MQFTKNSTHLCAKIPWNHVSSGYTETSNYQSTFNQSTNLNHNAMVKYKLEYNVLSNNLQLQSNVYVTLKLNHRRRNDNLPSFLSPTVQNEIFIIETIEVKHCYQIYKRTRIFVTPRVIEFSMKSKYARIHLKSVSVEYCDLLHDQH